MILLKWHEVFMTIHISKQFKFFAMNTTSKIILGIVGAAAAGAVIGMLVAPEKGTELRNKIASNARDWAGEFADWLNARQNDLKDVKRSMASHAERVADETGNQWKKAKSALS